MRYLSLALLLVFAMAFVVGCESSAPEKAPAEPAKGAVEKAGAATGAALEKAGEATGAALEKAGEATGAAVEKAGEAAGAAVEKVTEADE